MSSDGDESPAVSHSTNADEDVNEEEVEEEQEPNEEDDEEQVENDDDADEKEDEENVEHEEGDGEEQEQENEDEEEEEEQEHDEDNNEEDSDNDNKIEAHEDTTNTNSPKQSKPRGVDVFGDELDDLSGESNDEETVTQSKSKKIVSDEESDNEKNEAGNKESLNVFGDDLADLSGDSDNYDSTTHNKTKSSNAATEAEEEEQEAEQLINVEIPRIKADLGKELHFVKLPNFLSVEPRPFDPEFYEDENLNTDALDEEGKTRVKLKVENTIRWRLGKNNEGELIKESNARMVRWSDGSLSLHLGDEIFDVYKQYMQGDYNHLFLRQGTGLQGQAVFRTKLAFRPHSTDSLTHRKMTLSLVDRGTKTQKVKILTDVTKNPELQRTEMIKKEEEKLKAASRRENQQRRLREKSHAKHITSSYLEDKYSDEDENPGISLSAIKNRYRGGNKNEAKNSMYSSSDEESERGRRLNKAKISDNESDDDRGQSKKKKKVVSDDDE